MSPHSYLRVDASTSPRIGKTIETNEDAAIARTWELDGRRLGLVGVADGLGNCFSSARTSRLALDTIAEEVSLRLDQDLVEALRAGVIAAQERIIALVPDGRAGTTVACALVTHDECVVAHVGDSRAAILGAESYWCTLDHTKLAKTLGRNPSRIEAKTMPGAKRLRRTLGDLAFKVEWIDLRRVQAPSEFLGVLLCTDGVWTECELQELVTECVAARGYSAAEEIVTTALTRDPTDDCAVAIAMRADPEEGLLEHLAQQAMSAPRPL